jgi:RNA polymerase sigma-70 factor (ECF subfamily)
MFPSEPVAPDLPLLDVDLFRALEQLREEHRIAVLLTHGYGYTYRQVAEVLDVSEAAVTNFVHRGMTKLRSILGDDPT